jgi:hypothetical protein
MHEQEACAIGSAHRRAAIRRPQLDVVEATNPHVVVWRAEADVGVPEYANTVALECTGDRRRPLSPVIMIAEYGEAAKWGRDGSEGRTDILEARSAERDEIAAKQEDVGTRPAEALAGEGDLPGMRRRSRVKV